MIALLRHPPLAISIALFVWAASLERCTPSPASAQTYSEQEILIARLAVNEATWREADVAAIAYARALYSPAELRNAHRRALAVGRTDSRRWIETLGPDLARPAGWPEHLVPWETRGRIGWERTLHIVHDVVSGRVVPCSGVRPSTWGGTMDRARIERMTANGWRVVSCGQVANTYLRRGER